MLWDTRWPVGWASLVISSLRTRLMRSLHGGSLLRFNASFLLWCLLAGNLYRSRRDGFSSRIARMKRLRWSKSCTHTLRIRTMSRLVRSSFSSRSSIFLTSRCKSDLLSFSGLRPIGDALWLGSYSCGGISSLVNLSIYCSRRPTVLTIGVGVFVLTNYGVLIYASLGLTGKHKPLCNHYALRYEKPQSSIPSPHTNNASKPL